MNTPSLHELFFFPFCIDVFDRHGVDVENESLIRKEGLSVSQKTDVRRKTERAKSSRGMKKNFRVNSSY